MSHVKKDFEERLPAKIAAKPDKAKAIGAIFVFQISGDDGGTWTVDLKNDVGIREGAEEGADCTFKMSDEDWVTMSRSPSKAMKLFFTGRVKVEGNMMVATKLSNFLS